MHIRNSLALCLLIAAGAMAQDRAPGAVLGSARCGANFDDATCPASQCCSAEGWCSEKCSTDPAGDDKPTENNEATPTMIVENNDTRVAFSNLAEPLVTVVWTLWGPATDDANKLVALATSTRTVGGPSFTRIALPTITLNIQTPPVSTTMPGNSTWTNSTNVVSGPAPIPATVTLQPIFPTEVHDGGIVTLITTVIIPQTTVFVTQSTTVSGAGGSFTNGTYTGIGATRTVFAPIASETSGSGMVARIDGLMGLMVAIGIGCIAIA